MRVALYTVGVLDGLPTFLFFVFVLFIVGFSIVIFVGLRGLFFLFLFPFNIFIALKFKI